MRMLYSETNFPHIKGLMATLLAWMAMVTSLLVSGCTSGQQPASSNDHGVFVTMDGNKADGLRIRVITESGKEVYSVAGIKNMQNGDSSVFIPKPGSGDGSGWGVMLTTASGKIMIIDRFGRKTIDPPGVPEFEFTDGLTSVVQRVPGGTCGYMDMNHQMKIAYTFERCQGFSEGMAAVFTGGKYGYINTEGEMKIAPQFDQTCTFVEGFARVYKNGVWSVIDRSGKVIFDNARTGCARFSEGLMPAHTKDGQGFVDHEGKFIIPAKYANGTEFADGRAFVKVPEGLYDGHYILIDKTGTEIPTPRLSGAATFEHGLAPAKQELKWGLMDTQGRFVVAPKYDSIGDLSSGLRAAIIQDQSTRSTFFLDERGVEVKPPAPYCEAYRHGVFLCVKDPRQGGLDFLNPALKRRNVIDYLTRSGTRIGGIDLTGFLEEEKR